MNTLRYFVALFSVALYVFSFGPTAWSQAKYAHTGPTIITNVSVIDGLGNKPARGRDLLIQGGKIAAIGPSGSVKAPAGARKIDGKGLTAMPGLIDLHTHTLGGWANGTVEGKEFAPSYDMRKVRRNLLANLYSGVTTVLDMGASFRWVIDVRNRVNRDEILGPRMFVVGAPITQRPSGWLGPDPLAITDYSNIPDFLDEYQANGIKIIKLYRGISVQVAWRVVEAAHKRDMKVVADLWSMNLDALWMRGTNLDGWAHLGGPHVVPKAVFELMKKDKRFIVTTVTLGETLSGIRITEDKNKSFLRNPLVVDIYGRKEIEKYYANATKGRKFFYTGKHAFYQTEGFGEMLRYRRNFLINVKRAYDAGVFLAGGTDAPYLGLFIGEGMHRELELLVKAGIPPLEAIKICTRNGAKVLGVADKIGALKVGMEADIILVRGDPSKNISDTRNIRHVFKQGKLIDRAAIKIQERGKLVDRNSLKLKQ